VPDVSLADAGTRKEASASAGSLEPRSLLPPNLGDVRVTLWGTAGEASIAVVPDWFSELRAPREQTEADREAHRRSNASRAARAVRLFTRGNGLTYLWTGTYAEAAEDRAKVVADIRRFFERVQAKYGRMPIVAVVERGRRGTKRLHVHFAVKSWLPHQVIRDLWRHGHVYVGDPGKLQGHPDARQLSGYLAKYIRKQFDAGDGQVDEDREDGRHRYLVTQGWHPDPVKVRFDAVDQAAAWLARIYGQPERVWPWVSQTMWGLAGFVVTYGDECIADWLPGP
jgi:ribosomal protein L44E